MKRLNFLVYERVSACGTYKHCHMQTFSRLFLIKFLLFCWAIRLHMHAVLFRKC